MVTRKPKREDATDALFPEQLSDRLSKMPGKPTESGASLSGRRAE